MEAVGDQLLLFNLHPVQEGQQGIVVEIHIGQGGKEALHHHGGGGIAEHMLVALGGPGQTDQAPRELVLKGCRIRRLAAHTHCAGASGAFCGLFTLKTKHIRSSFTG